MRSHSKKETIQLAVLAALMHVKPDYRSPARLDECAGVIADFVIGELDNPQNGVPTMSIDADNLRRIAKRGEAVFNDEILQALDAAAATIDRMELYSGPGPIARDPSEVQVLSGGLDK